MSAPTEPRRAEDVLQEALVEQDRWYQSLFGLPATWSAAVVREYLLDLHLERRRAANWGEAA
ncbi:hypothetical protein [Streptomyces sp. NPDC059708]|uniref:hypothetical protein n=1 Tax=Streptomyces sp. NPDC059708 TaxID=3346916 RepID=UPI003690E23F